MHSSTVRDLAGHSCFIQAIQLDGHFFYEVFWAANTCVVTVMVKTSL